MPKALTVISGLPDSEHNYNLELRLDRNVELASIDRLY